MKLKIITLMLGAVLAGRLTTLADDNSPAKNDPGSSPVTTAPAVIPVASTTEAATPSAPASDTTTATASTSAPAGDATAAATKPSSSAGETPASSASAASLPSTPTVAAAETTTATPAAAVPAPTLAAADTTPPAPVAPTAAAPAASTSSASGSSTIPLIVMDEVPLTDAVKNLARQANLNYMIDPRISFGQPGPDGKPAAQPNVSLRWENISAEQALTALLANYGLQLIQDPKTKIASVKMKDPAAPDPLVTDIIQLKYSSPSNILGSVQTALTDKRSRVMADVRTSQLVVVATEKEMEAVTNLVDRLDTPTKQVLIEARLLETSINPQSIRGLDWSGTVQAQHLAVGNNLQQNSASVAVNNTLSQTMPRLLMDTASGLNPATAFLDADGVSAVFSFLNNNSESKVLSTPRTVTLDNQEARLSVTKEIPIFSSTPSSANTPGSSSVTYSNLGVILDVTPRISANNYVNLKVTPEVSRVAGDDTQTVNGEVNTAHIFSVQRMETTVLIPSGNTLVLGGLAQDDVEKQSTKVPILGDIPGLGYAFRSSSKKRQKTNLLVFITPTIIADDDFQVTKSNFLKTPVAHDHDLDPHWSALDNSTPYDWSKLVSHKSKSADGAAE